MGVVRIKQFWSVLTNVPDDSSAVKSGGRDAPLTLLNGHDQAVLQGDPNIQNGQTNMPGCAGITYERIVVGSGMCHLSYLAFVSRQLSSGTEVKLLLPASDAARTHGTPVIAQGNLHKPHSLGGARLDNRLRCIERVRHESREAGNQMGLLS